MRILYNILMFVRTTILYPTEKKIFLREHINVKFYGGI